MRVGVNHRAQAILELALCLAVAATAIGSMVIYVRRSLQARYRAGVVYCLKSIEDNATSANFPIKLSAGKHQYEPYYTREASSHEEKKGTVTEGFPNSSIDMETKTGGWRETPLPEMWRRE